MTIKKEFSSVAVAAVAQGTVLAEDGFPEIRDVFNHLYPGIMTIGIACMSEHAQHEIVRQHPALASLPKANKDTWREVAATVELVFGKTLSVDGPFEGEIPPRPLKWRRSVVA